MRTRWFPLIVGALALAALTVHFAVPFAQIVVQDQEGAIVRDEVLSLGEFKDARAAAETSVVPTGAGLTYMLVSMGIMLVGAVVFAVSARMAGVGRNAWVQLISAGTTALGAAMTVQNQALWVGRGFNAWIQKIMGWDNPPESWSSLYADYSSADAVTYLTVISPVIVLAITITLIAYLAKAWTSLVRDERDMRTSARQHGRLAFIGALIFSMVAIMPWVVTVAAGSVQPAGAEVADDTFFWSAYDVMLLKEISYAAAVEEREAGIVLWDDLGTLLGIVMLTSLLAILAPFIGLLGKHMESLNQPVFGRLIESGSLATVLLYPFTILAAFLASFALHDPNDIVAARTTGIALIAAIGGIVGTVYALLSARTVVADETGLVADDFPEPVLYD